jgi:hypothetical protein
MSIFDVIAVLGALAWTPHAIILVRSWINKPEIRVITSKSVQLGYTTLGTVLNLHIAFSTRNKDIVITAIRIILKHDSGEAKQFEWQGVQQEVMKMTAPDGSILPYQKENSVLAIKLTEKDIEERFILFQQSSFHSQKTEKENTILKEVFYLKGQGKFNEREYINSEKMQELFEYIKQSFSWKTGSYEVLIEVDSPSKFTISDNKYSFVLTPIDIQQLEKNKDFIEQYYKNILVPPTDDEYKSMTWNWRNPTLNKQV